MISNAHVTTLTTPRRCLLFVPGSRPERFAKAVATGADMVCIDLEDAVGPADKANARAQALAFATQQHSCELVLRINSLRTLDGLQDLASIASAETPPSFVMLAKVSSASEVEIAAEVLAGKSVRLIALIETALGIERAFEIAKAPKLVMLMLGGADLSAESGALMNFVSLQYARSRIASAAASAGLGCIDVPFLDVSDAPGLIAETKTVADLGIRCKSAIHPSQVGPIQAALMPSSAEIAAAQRVLAAFANSAHDAVLVDNKLVDRPILLAAERTLARSLARADLAARA
jgi:citrate lyase beta subunit